MDKPGKLFQEPEWFEKEMNRIQESLEAQEILNQKKIPEKNELTSNKEMDDEKVMFQLWLKDQFERYDKVYEAVKYYYIKEKKPLPYDKGDFLKWFVKEAKKDEDYLLNKIEDFHFEKYHEERLKLINEPKRWRGLFDDLKDKGYIQTDPKKFNNVMEHKHLGDESERIIWLKTKADAWYFLESFKFTRDQYNRCFINKDGRELWFGSKTTTNRKEPLPSIIKAHIHLLK